METTQPRFSTERMRLLRALGDSTDAPRPPRPLGRADRSEPLPASRAQVGLWLADQLLGEARRTAYNVPIALRLSGRLDVAALEHALSEVVRRHEVLRTSVVSSEGVPVQRLHAAVPVDLPVVDTTPHEVDALLAADAARPFDLAAGPPLRIRLYRCAPEEHALSLVVHHIVFDGLSGGILLDEVGRLYAAAVTGRSVTLPDLDVQYADYAAWQQESLADGTLDRHADYWRSELDGAPALLDLPTNRPRPPVASTAGGEVGFEVPTEVAARLRDLARTERATLFMVMLAAFGVVLGRWSGQQDLCVGTPVSGRTRRELDHVIGYFVNPVVLRLRLAGRPTFRELLSRVRETTVGAYEHQDLPFNQLVAELHPERTLAHNPLYQVAMVMQTADSARLELPDLVAEPIDVATDDAKGDLVLDVSEDGESLGGTLGFRRDLFDAATVEQLVGRLMSALSGLAADPDVPVDDLDLLHTGERELLLFGRNRTDHPVGPSPVAAQFAAQVAARPDAVAVVDERGSMTYGELDRQAGRLACTLRKHGAAPDEVVGVLLPRGRELVVALVAVLKTGAAYLPLDPSMPTERIFTMVEDARPRCLVTGSDNHVRLASRGVSAAPVVVPDEAVDAAPGEHTDPAGPPDVRPGHLAYTVFTSGSTGRPKAVEVTQAGMANQLAWLSSSLAFDHADAVLARTSPGFDAAVAETWLPLLAGGRLCIAPEEIVNDAYRLVDLGNRLQATVVMFTPSLLAEVPDDALFPTVRHVVTGGEPLSAALAERISRQWDAAVAHQYGPTETTITAVATGHTSARTLGTEPLGTPVWNTRIYLLDDRMRPVADGTPGEVYIGGAQVARGYRSRPGLTADRFVPDPFGPTGSRLYRTGDVARWLPSGELSYLGRVDLQVKVRGYRIELGEVEAALAALDGVREAVVTVREDAPGDRRLVAYYLPTADVSRPPAAAALRAALGTVLPAYMLPAAFVPLEVWPLTANDKLDRRSLPAPQQRADESYVAPATATERRLARIWAEVLGVARVGTLDDFFELGGHSLHATRLVAHVRAETGVDLPLSTVFESPTVAQLAERVDDGGPAERHSPLSVLQQHGSRPPLVLVHPVGGTVFCYRELARRLGPDRPVYGLSSVPPDAGGESPETIEEMASAYLDALPVLNDDLVLGGWSLGGVVAFEMARQLQDRGVRPRLVLIDSPAPRPGDQTTSCDLDDPQILAAFVEDWCRSAGTPAPLPAAGPLSTPAAAARLLTGAGHAVGQDAELVERLARTYRRNVRALHAYRPRTPYAGPITVLWAGSDEDGAAGPETPTGWLEWGTSTVQATRLDGDHYSVLRAPDLDGLLAALGLDHAPA